MSDLLKEKRELAEHDARFDQRAVNRGLAIGVVLGILMMSWASWFDGKPFVDGIINPLIALFIGVIIMRDIRRRTRSHLGLVASLLIFNYFAAFAHSFVFQYFESSIPNDFEFPMSGEPIVMQHPNSNLYMNLWMYSRMQVYDANGRFLKSWPIAEHYRVSEFEFDENGDIHALAHLHRYRYSAEGAFISVDSLPVESIRTEIEKLERTRKKSRTQYTVPSFPIPHLAIQSSDGISRSLKYTRPDMIFWTIPFPLIPITGLGFVIYLISLHRARGKDPSLT